MRRIRGEGLERIRNRKVAKKEDDDDEFDYEDAVAIDVDAGENDDEDDGAWDEDVGVGEVSSGEDVAESSEEEKSATQKPARLVKSVGERQKRR